MEIVKINSWKIIFNVWGVLFALTIISDLSERTVDVFNTAVLAIGLTGLYGLAFNKAIWSQKFWRIFVIGLSALMAIILIVVGLSVFSNLANTASESQWSDVGAWEIVFGAIYLVLYFSQIYGLYQYSFKRDSIWKKHT